MSKNVGGGRRIGTVKGRQPERIPLNQRRPEDGGPVTTEWLNRQPPPLGPSPDPSDAAVTEPPDDLLRLLAREAMSVGWYEEGFFRAFINEDDEEAFTEADARYFAAITPTVILGLLDRLSALPSTPVRPDPEAERALNRLVPLLPSTARVHDDYNVVRAALRATPVRPDLTAALDDIDAAHRRGGGWMPECVTCRQTWPCTAAESSVTLRAALRAEQVELCSCGGRRWVEDENWTPDDPKSWNGERYKHDGLIPCGFCNEAGWDVPEWTPHATPVRPDLTALVHRLGFVRWGPPEFEYRPDLSDADGIVTEPTRDQWLAALSDQASERRTG